ncbi:hypothetical protein IWQ60_012127 [Tieghemiomyces parasiticus]|uniref:Nucleolar complex-associated protein 3 n=1 Tax=Tieghemiomyces parasiticus TaxID=78921 RepID=A0A9W7ZFV2_9FUNG|nr:hypothetical protein IWQ60_012127 [Tieghemiomyces parasiticus]
MAKTKRAPAVDYNRILDTAESDSDDAIVNYAAIEASDSESDADLPALDLNDSDSGAESSAPSEPDSDEDNEDDASDVEDMNALYDDALDDLAAGPPTTARSKRRSTQDVEEATYERQPRAVAPEAPEPKRLPIKLKDGRLLRSQEPAAAAVPVADPAPPVLTAPVPTATELAGPFAELCLAKLGRRQFTLRAKTLLAETAQQVIENPEENVGGLRRLRLLAEHVIDLPSVYKMALLTQLAVYKDIIPGYMIRALTAEELATKVTKEVKQLRMYEENLVKHYQRYLQTLDQIMKDSAAGHSERPGVPSLAQVAAQCLCDLLVAVPHFNFRLNILATVVGRMGARDFTEVPQLCCRAVIELFREDESGRYSLDAVQAITKLIKAKSYNVNQEVVKSFLHLRLRDELDPTLVRESSTGKDAESAHGKSKRSAQDAPHMSKRARKTLKETKAVERELRLAEAEVSKEEKQKWHTETLKMVFVTYFRILKNRGLGQLLPSVLEGLAKFAHLISIEFFTDLLAVLKSIMSGRHQYQVTAGAPDLDEEEMQARVSTRVTLLCVTTAFQLLSGQGEALEIDLKDFYTALYQILPRLTAHPHLERANSQLGTTAILEARVDSESDLMLKALEILFFKRGKVPVTRAAAFAKRLVSAALHFPPRVAVRCITLVRMMLMKYPRLDQLLTTEETLSSGVYLRDLDDPELCNPFATNLWEVHVLARHYHPHVRREVGALMKQCVQLQR